MLRCERMVLRLLLFNLVTDADDPILGFATGWIRALAQRVEFINVVTMRAGKVDVPHNVRVYSVGKEKGYSEPRRIVEFYRHLFRIVRADSIDACFSHMMPLFTILAAPVLKSLRIPIVTWYAHPSVTRTLKLAHRFSDRMVTSIATSYPYKHDKLLVVGHGIDGNIFAPGESALEQRMATILCVGRLSPVKDHFTLLRAAKLLRQRWSQPFRVVILGAPGSARDDSHIRWLQKQVEALDLQDTVYFEPPTAITGLPTWYRRCTVHVNLTPSGFVDKVALEAMSCAKPCLMANEGFRETLGRFADQLLFRHGDAEHLAERLLALLMLDDRRRDEIGRYLHGRMVQLHSLKNLTSNLVEVLENAKRWPRGELSARMGNH
jgi:glycosyltransferase involved in cell wall biosynthesis